jgi:hypothetical protein
METEAIRKAKWAPRAYERRSFERLIAVFPFVPIRPNARKEFPCGRRVAGVCFEDMSVADLSSGGPFAAYP